MRLKALLIDDEANILRNLQLVLPWAELEIDVIGLAKNGVQAMEYVLEHRPELILCDIRMPVMDGIQFLERMREVDAEAEVIMLTGYQDFEYARTVIRFGVRDYILKPIDYDELSNVIRRLAAGVQAKRKLKFSEEQRLGEAMTLAYEKLLYDVLMDYASVPVNAPYLYGGEFDLAHLRFSVLLADFDDYSLKYRSANEQERKLWNFAVRNVMQEALLTEGLRYAVLQMREGEWCILVELSDEDAAGVEEMRRWAMIAQKAVADHVKINLSIGIYAREVSVSELPAVYKNLQRTVQLAADKKSSILVSGETLSAKTKDSLMDSAREYIRRNLARDLGIDELADYLDISASYFSLLFKQRYGCTFVEYLTNERMELAKSLLLSTDRSITDIGRSVGYLERRYFTKVFLKNTGQIPSEYREKRR